MKISNLKYFLAANSCEGFVSYFTDRYSAQDGWKCFIIKGGPGTGKSSFMKYIAAKAAENNIKAELCPCSSDPHSLDAVVLPDKKIIVLDGTAPHTVDPVYPGVCEEILNFGEFWNTKVLKPEKNNIIKLTDKNKALHRVASRYMHALGQIISDNLKIAENATEKDKITKFASRLAKKYIPKKPGTGSEEIRFLCGITPKGIISFSDSALSLASNRIIIEDRFGTVASEIMKNIRKYALSNGYNIITVKNAFMPSSLTDHIIIPELSLCFLREYEYQHFNTDCRRIHARRFMNNAVIAKNRERLKFNKKIIRELMLSAIAVLSEAKKVHDELEENYINSMDFDALTMFANSFCEDIFR